MSFKCKVTSCLMKRCLLYYVKSWVDIVVLYIAKVGTGIEEWINVNSYQGGRNTSSFQTNDEVYIIVIIKKISNKRKSLIHQSPNQYSYELDWKA